MLRPLGNTDNAIPLIFQPGLSDTIIDPHDASLEVEFTHACKMCVSLIHKKRRFVLPDVIVPIKNLKKSPEPKTRLTSAWVTYSELSLDSAREILRRCYERVLRDKTTKLDDWIKTTISLRLSAMGYSLVDQQSDRNDRGPGLTEEQIEEYCRPCMIDPESVKAAIERIGAIAESRSADPLENATYDSWEEVMDPTKCIGLPADAFDRAYQLMSTSSTAADSPQKPLIAKHHPVWDRLIKFMIDGSGGNLSPYLMAIATSEHTDVYRLQTILGSIPETVWEEGTGLESVDDSQLI